MEKKTHQKFFEYMQHHSTCVPKSCADDTGDLGQGSSRLQGIARVLLDYQSGQHHIHPLVHRHQFHPQPDIRPTQPCAVLRTLLTTSPHPVSLDVVLPLVGVQVHKVQWGHGVHLRSLFPSPVPLLLFLQLQPAHFCSMPKSRPKSMRPLP